MASDSLRGAITHHPRDIRRPKGPRRAGGLPPHEVCASSLHAEERLPSASGSVLLPRRGTLLVR